jgi:hypothetical protein
LPCSAREIDSSTQSNKHEKRNIGRARCARTGKPQRDSAPTKTETMKRLRVVKRGGRDPDRRRWIEEQEKPIRQKSRTGAGETKENPRSSSSTSQDKWIKFESHGKQNLYSIKTMRSKIQLVHGDHRSPSLF